MSRLGITFEDVEEIAEKILADGENPTIEKIRRESGTGSNSTISKYLHEWRANRLIASTDNLPAPNTPPDPVHAAVNHVWEKIRLESAEEIKKYRETASAEIELAKKECENAISSRDLIQQEFEICQKRLNHISADKEILILDLKAIQQEHLLLQEKYSNLKQQYELFQQQTNNQISILMTANQNEIQNRKSEVENIKETHNNVLNKLIESHENHRQQHIVEIENYKIEQQQQKITIKHLESIIQSVNVELDNEKSTVQLIKSERDTAIAESQTNNKLIEFNCSLNKNLDLIMKEVINLKNSVKNDELISLLFLLNKSTNNIELLSTSIFDTLTNKEVETE